MECVETFFKQDQLESLESIANENFLLYRLIIRYQEHRARVMQLLQKAREALVALQAALEICIQEIKDAERDWLAFWGIDRECSHRE